MRLRYLSATRTKQSHPGGSPSGFVGWANSMKTLIALLFLVTASLAWDGNRHDSLAQFDDPQTEETIDQAYTADGVPPPLRLRTKTRVHVDDRFESLAEQIIFNGD